MWMDSSWCSVRYSRFQNRVRAASASKTDQAKDSTEIPRRRVLTVVCGGASGRELVTTAGRTEVALPVTTNATPGTMWSIAPNSESPPGVKEWRQNGPHAEPCLVGALPGPVPAESLARSARIHRTGHHLRKRMRPRRGFDASARISVDLPIARTTPIVPSRPRPEFYGAYP